MGEHNDELRCPRCGGKIIDGYADVKYKFESGEIEVRKEDYLMCENNKCGFYCLSMRNLRNTPPFLPDRQNRP